MTHSKRTWTASCVGGTIGRPSVNSDNRAATLPNGTNPAYRAVTQANSGATVCSARRKDGIGKCPMTLETNPAALRRVRLLLSD
jgi:hypothetical protein